MLRLLLLLLLLLPLLLLLLQVFDQVAQAGCGREKQTSLRVFDGRRQWLGLGRRWGGARVSLTVGRWEGGRWRRRG